MTDTTPSDPPVRERRLRARAARLGYALRKARIRVPASPLFGTFDLVDVHTNTVAASDGSDGYGLSLDDIDEMLTHEEERA